MQVSGERQYLFESSVQDNTRLDLSFNTSVVESNQFSLTFLSHLDRVSVSDSFDS